MLTRKLTHLEAHAIAHRLRQAGEVVAGVVEELVGMDSSPDCGQVGEAASPSREGGERQGALSIAEIEAFAIEHLYVGDDDVVFGTEKFARAIENAVLAASAPTLGEEQWPSARDAAIQACALMILGICKTEPQEVWPKRIEGRIRYMLTKIAPAVAPTLNESVTDETILADAEEAFGRSCEYSNYFASPSERSLLHFVKKYMNAPAQPQAAEPKGLTDEQRDAWMKSAGYKVHSKDSHVGTAWDFTFPGKTGMDNRHYRSEQAARDAAIAHFEEAVTRACALLSKGA